jgi:hypothetical protein
VIRSEELLNSTMLKQEHAASKGRWREVVIKPYLELEVFPPDPVVSCKAYALSTSVSSTQLYLGARKEWNAVLKHFLIFNIL